MYYSLNKASIDPNILKAVAAKNAPVDVYDKKWRQSIAALHYGLPLGDALLAVVGPPLEEAIENRRPPAFLEHMSVRGAHGVLHRIITGYRTSPYSVLRKVLRTAYVLNSIETDMSVELAMWRMLAETFIVVQSWPEFTKQDITALVAIVQHVPDRSVPLIAAVNAGLSGVEKKPAAFVVARLWRALYDAQREAVANLSFILIPGDAQVVLSVAEQLADVPILAGKMNSPTSLDLVAALINDMEPAADSMSRQRVERRQQAVAYSELEIQWPLYIDKAISKLEKMAETEPFDGRQRLELAGGALASMASYGRPATETSQKIEAFLLDRIVFLVTRAYGWQAWKTLGVLLALARIYDLELPALERTPPHRSAWPPMASGYIRTLTQAGISNLSDSTNPSDPDAVAGLWGIDERRLQETVKRLTARYDERERRRRQAKAEAEEIVLEGL